MLPKLLSQLIPQTIQPSGSFKHALLIFERFDQYWSTLASDACQKDSVHLQPLVFPSVSHVLSLMGLAGAFQDGTTITTILVRTF